MKYNSLLVKNSLWLTTIICCIIMYGSLFDTAHATSTTIEVEGTYYQFGEDTEYKIKDSKKVDEMKFGRKSIGNFSIKGDFNTTTIYNEYNAHGVYSGSVSFSYVTEDSLQDRKSTEWHLINYEGKRVNDVKLDAKINEGAVIVQKSIDGTNWELAANPVVDFFDDNPNGKEDFYTTDGADLVNGTYYKIYIAYYTSKTIKDKYAFVFDGHDYKGHLEEYTFFLCNNNGTISIHDLTSNDDIEQKKVDGFTTEEIKKAETMLDNSTTNTGFSIDKLGQTYTVKVNGEEAEDGATFKVNGKYTIVVETKLGKSISKTIYVFHDPLNKGFDYYFDEFFVDGKRVFREGDYPTYASGARINIKSIKEDIPVLTGSIVNETTGESYELPFNRYQNRSAKVFTLNSGTYNAELYSGNIESGSVYHYSYKFTVVDEEAKPYVNYRAINSTERVTDYISKHYEVAYQTTGGGYIYVCFKDYDEAFKYAYDIEKRYLEKDGEDGIRYKSESNPNEKVKYPIKTDADKIKLTKIINGYARKNVVTAYFDASEEYTYRTCADDDELLKCLEDSSITKSVRVFSSEEEKEKLLDRVPYINGYSFMHVDDYDVVSVTAYGNNDAYNIEFRKKVDEQLEASGKYKIEEVSKYGDKINYDVVYMGENQTELEYIYTSEGVEKTEILNCASMDSKTKEIYCSDFELKKGTNSLDEYAIIKIERYDNISYNSVMLVSEIESNKVVLKDKGVYTITLVDRTGNIATLIVNVR